MEINLKTSWKADKSTIQKFFFLENLEEGLRQYAITNNLESCPELKRTNYKHHAEIHDITFFENGKEKSMLELFDIIFINNNSYGFKNKSLFDL
jgi:hypothetical protein